MTAAGCACCCHSGGAYPPPCNTPGGCGPHERTCALAACTNQPAPPLLLCRGHASKVGQWLADLDQLYATLDTRPGNGSDWNRTSGGTLASHRAPGRLDLIALTDPRTRQWTADTGQPRRTRAHHVGTCDGHCRGRCTARGVGPWCLFCQHDTCVQWRRSGPDRDGHDDEQDAGSQQLLSVPAVLAEWAAMVREVRQLAPLERMPTVVSERSLLAAHLDWCLAQDWAADFYGEIRRCWSLLKSGHGEHAAKPAAVCWVPVPGGTCDGPVWAGRGSAHCSRCGTTWAGTEFLRISLALDEGAA